MNDSRQTLVILTPAFPGDETETVWVTPKQVFVRTLGNAFPALDIVILSFQYPKFRGEYDWEGHRVISFNGQGKGKFFRLLLWWKVWRRLNRLKKQTDILGLFSFWCGECALVGKCWGKRNGIKHMTWISGQDALKGNHYARLMRPAPSELIAMSDFLSRNFLAHYGVRPAYTIPIGIDPDLFGKDPVEKDIDILGAGALIPLKQYDIFLQVMSRLSADLHFLRGVLCGGGREETRMRTLIDRLHIQPHVVLKGETPHPELLGLMRRCKVFLHPSSYEGFGAVCIEALFAGAHVISFCRPMDAWIPRWHVVNTVDEMYEKALELLREAPPPEQQVMPYRMEDSVHAVMDLFGIPGTLKRPADGLA